MSMQIQRPIQSPIHLKVGDTFLVRQKHSQVNKLSSPYKKHPYIKINHGSMITAQNATSYIARSSSAQLMIMKSTATNHQIIL